MNTEVKFYPSDPNRAKTLTPAQIKEFNQDGYVAPLDALSPVETLASRRYFDSLLERMHEFKDGRNAYAIMSYHNRCKGIWDLAHHPRLLDYVEDLLGPNFVCWSSHYFCKVPGDTKRVPWHQDATYWPVRPTKTVTVWLAIDDVTHENAPMKFLPGSHRQAAIHWEPAEGEVALAQEIPDITKFAEPYENVMHAGQISLHTSTLVHGSDPNNSTMRRCGLTLRYIPSDCSAIGKAREPVMNNGIVVRGEAMGWRDNPRPPHDDLTPIHKVYMD